MLSAIFLILQHVSIAYTSRSSPAFQINTNTRTTGFSVLENIQFPADLKSLQLPELKTLATELRSCLVNSVASTGGHFGSSLGVVELTVALHKVFDAPKDRFLWDVSHQAYPHKMLTGRRSLMSTIRKKNGISGFCKRSESEYDCFGAGHSSTSISAAQGMTVGRKITGEKEPNHCIAIIGDGAATAGMVYEALNSCGHLKTPLLTILNDNGQVSLPTGMAAAGGRGPPAAFSSYTARLLTSRPFMKIRNAAKGFTKIFPDKVQEAAAKLDEISRGMLTGGTLFEDFGFYYVGPVDGHDIETLVKVLTNIKESDYQRPVLLHVRTEKGHGYGPAETASDKMHGVTIFDAETGKQVKPVQEESLTQVFSKTLTILAEKDPKVVAITAAMPGGTGVGAFGEKFADRTFDVGIAEQHAVTFSAGLAAEGVKPFCCIYSTFMQRAYDQLIHDVALQDLPVRFILDRAGFVGPDGATHHGAYDTTFISTIPGIISMAPSNELELINAITTAYSINDAPTVVRYPKMNAFGDAKLIEHFRYTSAELSRRLVPLPVGRGRIISQGHDIAILATGGRVFEAIKAADQLKRKHNISSTVVDMRFIKPLDVELITKLANAHSAMVTVEEGTIGGFGSHVQNFLFDSTLLDSGRLKFRSLIMPDMFIENASQEQQYEESGLNCSGIVSAVLALTKVAQPSKNNFF